MPPAEDKWSFPFSCSIFLPRPEHLTNRKQWQKTNSVFLNMRKDKQPMHCIILRESFSTLCAMKHRWPIKQWELGKRWPEQFYIEIWDIVHSLKLQCIVFLNIFLNQQAPIIVLFDMQFLFRLLFMESCNHFCHKTGLFTDHITSLRKRPTDPVHIVI